ncbi:MAG: hypothetical protein HRU75_12800 [Planctomycetia bacterium]|nr:MAG: hypothetical protein HRU75_12800 [Planctomycetia bacterium]
MLPELPERALLLTDAGLVGYRVLTRLQNCGHAFIVRVGRNVTLLRKLGYHLRERAGVVYLWPDTQRRTPPLTLRLVLLQAGRQHVGAADQRAGRAAAQRCGCCRPLPAAPLVAGSDASHAEADAGQAKLRAQTPELAACELDWSMAGLWLISLLTHNAAQPPRLISPAAALRVIRTAMRRGRRPTGKHWLQRQLRTAVPDFYLRRRPKTARDWPHKKTEPPPGTPRIRTATTAEIRKAQAFRKEKGAA